MGESKSVSVSESESGEREALLLCGGVTDELKGRQEVDVLVCLVAGVDGCG